MNSVQIIGRLTKDIELRYAQTGTAIAMFTVAVNRRFKNQNGEREADFIRCKAFKKTAEILAQYTGKGSQIGIEGTIQTGSFDGQDGKKVFTTDVIVNNFDFLDSKGSQQQSQTQQQTQQPQQHQTFEQAGEQTQDPFEQPGGQINIQDQDLPF